MRKGTRQCTNSHGLGNLVKIMGYTVIHLSVQRKEKNMDYPKKAVSTTPATVPSGSDYQVQLVSELEKATSELGAKFSDYGKTCVINAIAGLVTVCKANKIEIKNLDPVLLRLQLQNIGFTELNYASIPSELYIDLRKTKDSNNNEIYSVAIKPQGAGNEKLVRKFGVGIKKDGLLPAWLVREGDEFTLGSFDGIKQTPPTWVRKSLDKKIVMVVYPVIKTNGDVEYLMASRDSIIPNLIAQIRQNSMNAFIVEVESKGYKYKKVDKDKRDAFYKEIEKDFEGKSLDDILAMEKYIDYINPTYTSGGSKEQMILRKMKNNALKNYPREYDTTLTKESVENMFEDNDDTVKEVAPILKHDVIDSVEVEIAEPIANEDAPKDFNVDEDGIVTKNETPENKEEKPLKKEEETDYGF